MEVLFFLGETATTEEARMLLTRYRTADIDGILRTVADHWDDVLGAVQVRTPDRSLDVMKALVDELQDDANRIVTDHHDKNRGKGAALRTGFARDSGKLVVIKDADQE